MSNSLSIRMQKLLQFDIDEGELLNKLNEIVVDEKLKQKYFNESESLEDLFIQHKNRFLTSERNPNLIKTGFKYIDKVIDGFMPGEYIVIGARPGNCLDLFLLQLANNISNDFPVLYVSMNNNYLTLTTLVVSMLTKIKPDKLLQNKLSDIDIELLSSLEKRLSGNKLLLNKASGYSIPELRVLCEQHVEEYATKVIIFDSLQLISPGFRTKNRRELEDNFINCELKRIARDLDVCVIAGCKLRNSFENRIEFDGDIQALFESGNVEQEANTVFVLHRPERYGITKDESGNSLIRKILVLMLKSERGSQAQFYLTFNENETAIVELDYDFPSEFYFENKDASDV